MTGPVQVDGLADRQGALRRARSDLPEILRVFLGKAADMTADDAASLVPRGPSGAARASLRVDRSQTAATVLGGGRRAPYYGWLEFGGRTGIKNSVERRFVRGGRYIWPAYDQNRKRLLAMLDDDVRDMARAAGLDVT